jgi:peptide/nickel transport system permease protein
VQVTTLMPDCMAIARSARGSRPIRTGETLIVMTSVYLSTAILTEAGVSYLGLGTQPPEPSWGGMFSAARNYMELSPWMAFFPGAAIMVVVLGFNFLGDGLRDVLDPRLRNV